MLTAEKHKFLCRFWFEHGEETPLERGGAQILDAVKEVESISKAANGAGMSYHYGWDYARA